MCLLFAFSLTSNKIGDRDATAIAKALEVNVVLTTLM